MILAITVASALVPSILLVWFFYSRDLRREPGRTVWATFGLGVLAVVPVLLVAWPVDQILAPLITHPLARGSARAVLTAAIPEEFFKFSVLYWYARQRRHFDEPMDGIVYGAIASLGFATLENVMYCAQGTLATALFRAFTSVPGHGFWGAIMGYYVGIAHFGPRSERAKWLVRALGWPMLLHAAYDAPLLAIEAYGQRALRPSVDALALLGVLLLGSLAVIIVTWVQGIRLTLRMRRAQRLTMPTPASPGGAPVPAPSPELLALAALWPRSAIEGAEPPPSAPPQASRPLAWLLLILGSVITVGAVLLMILMGIGLSLEARVTAGMAILVMALCGVLPLAVGVLLFALGLRKLPKGPRGVTAPVTPSG